MKLSNEIRDKLFEKLLAITREEHELEKLRAKLKESTERILTGYLFGAENAFNSMEKELPTDFCFGDCNDVIWREDRFGDLKYLEVVGFTSEIINDNKDELVYVFGVDEDYELYKFPLFQVENIEVLHNDVTLYIEGRRNGRAGFERVMSQILAGESEEEQKFIKEVLRREYKFYASKVHNVDTCSGRWYIYPTYPANAEKVDLQSWKNYLSWEEFTKFFEEKVKDIKANREKYEK